VQLFAEIAKKEENVQLCCAVTMDRTSATTRLVPKDRQRAYALRMMHEGATSGEKEDLVDLLPEGWHLETHNFDATKHGRISSWSPPFGHSLFTPEGSWVLYVAPPTLSGRRLPDFPSSSSDAAVAKTMMEEEAPGRGWW
jgi:hypothetical protein